MDSEAAGGGGGGGGGYLMKQVFSCNASTVCLLLSALAAVARGIDNGSRSNGGTSSSVGSLIYYWCWRWWSRYSGMEALAYIGIGSGSAGGGGGSSSTGGDWRP